MKTKRFENKTLWVKYLLFFPMLLFTFCQDENVEIIQDTNEVITKDSETILLMKSGVNDDSDEGQCLEYKYPVSFYVYFPGSESIGTIVINNDEELIHSFEQLASVDQISIDFPFVLLGTDGEEETIINNLTSLGETLRVAVDVCSGDSDSDFDICDSDNKKVNICHNGNTLCVSVNALQTHLNHGDVLGQCN